MFLAGLGMPSQLEAEDISVLLDAQERWQEQQEQRQKDAWAAQVRRGFN